MGLEEKNMETKKTNTGTRVKKSNEEEFNMEEYIDSLISDEFNKYKKMKRYKKTSNKEVYRLAMDKVNTVYNGISCQGILSINTIMNEMFKQLNNLNQMLGMLISQQNQIIKLLTPEKGEINEKGENKSKSVSK